MEHQLRDIGGTQATPTHLDVGQVDTRPILHGPADRLWQRPFGYRNVDIAPLRRGESVRHSMRLAFECPFTRLGAGPRVSVPATGPAGWLHAHVAAK